MISSTVLIYIYIRSIEDNEKNKFPNKRPYKNVILKTKFRGIFPPYSGFKNH